MSIIVYSLLKPSQDCFNEELAIANTVLELIGMVAAGLPDAERFGQKPPIVVILAGSRRSNYPQGLLVSCVFTGHYS
jgi:hypothetical protein